MTFWIDGITEDERGLLWAELASDLISEDLKNNPRKLSEQEGQELGLQLTLKYQEEKGLDYDYSELVVKYGTDSMKESYKQHTESN